MDKKKLIGTIIGVVLFALLIVGATYAWLTYTMEPTNGVYNVGTKNFIVNYVNGTDVNNVPLLATATTETAASLTVKANRNSSSSPGTFTIYLNTENDTSSVLLSSGALHYAVCISSCTNTSDLSSETYTGTVTSSGKLAILPNTTLNTSQTTYYVYFWLDAEDANQDVIGTRYSGYISAEATQIDTE